MSNTARFVTESVVLAPSCMVMFAELPTLPTMKAPPPVMLRRVSVVEPEL